MTALQLNANIHRDLDLLAENESALRKVANYLQRLVKQLTTDPTCMSKEEYFAMLDRAEQGPSHAMLPDEDLTAYLRRRGYDI